MAYIPKQEVITGSDLSGSDGEVNRTYTLTNNNSISAQFQIMLAGASLQAGIHYTKSGSVITFLQIVFDNQDIVLDYFVDSVPTLSSGDYVTTLQFAEFMHILGKVPSGLENPSSRVKENVGTGDNSTTIFRIANAFVLDGTYTFYYGSSADSVTALTETTHYTFDKDLGELTLTATGVTVVDTNNIYVKYKYCTIGLTDDQLQEVLDRAQNQVEKQLSTKFADGTLATPSYGKITNEKQDGKGYFNRAYYLNYFPLPDVSTNLDGSLTALATTITVDSTNGFPSTGFFTIENEKVTYTGKTSTTFTGCTRGANDSTAVAHDDNIKISPYVIEVSVTTQGTTPVWEVLKEDTEFDIDKNTGKVSIYKTDLLLDSTVNTHSPMKGVPNRFRSSYLYGWDEVPNDIVRLVLMIASKDLMHTAVRKATAIGHNEFNPGLINVDDQWIKDTMNSWKSLKVSNT